MKFVIIIIIRYWQQQQQQQHIQSTSNRYTYIEKYSYFALQDKAVAASLISLFTIIALMIDAQQQPCTHLKHEAEYVERGWKLIQAHDDCPGQLPRAHVPDEIRNDVAVALILVLIRHQLHAAIEAVAADREDAGRLERL
jgi:hypothetical protein